MTTFANLTSAGLTPFQALAINGFQTAIAATGTTQATAAQIISDNTIITSGPADSGVRLPMPSAVGDSLEVHNHTGNHLYLYPPVGGKAGYTMATNQPMDIQGASVLLVKVASLSPPVYAIFMGT